MTAQSSKTLTNSTLYEQDFCLWIEETLALLRDGRLSALDVPNLIEEIEEMGNSEKTALESNLRVLLMHLLQYRYQPQKRSGDQVAGNLRSENIEKESSRLSKKALALSTISLSFLMNVTRMPRR
jgi:predicted DNA-binding ribbon-helix-helix protein